MPLSNCDIESLQLTTPAFVYDEGSIISVLTKLKDIANASHCKVLFSLKAFAMIDALRLMVPMVDGFASSSLFEAELARDLLRDKGTIHITAPGLRPDDVHDLAELCDYISFNSLSQWNRFSEPLSDRVSCGLRVNPQLSFVTDDRYNPCRRNSKLGIPMETLVYSAADYEGRFRRLRGIHFHTNCESLSFEPLLATVKCLESRLGKMLEKLEWINMGGGYQYGEINTLEPFYEAVALLKRQYGLDVFIEPGEAIVGNAGYIVSSIVDLFESEGKTIAILDTSVNHMPSVFNYQHQPPVPTSNPTGSYVYLFAGATCLAGDLFGEYRFDTPLEIGSKVTFEFVGGYTLVKATMFNGINLPNIYAVNVRNELVLKRQYTIKDFISRWEST
jgi:carboxynorspermidine decarboxylase